METDNNTLINELLAVTEAATEKARKLRQLPESKLNFKEDPEKWSILECIEHLNQLPITPLLKVSGEPFDLLWRIAFSISGK